MTRKESLTERQQQTLEHLRRAQERGSSLVEYCSAFGLEVKERFSEAARRLKMPLASVSRRVADFEEQLGVLERSTRACCRRGTLRAPY
jgi:hypothetical protein